MKRQSKLGLTFGRFHYKATFKNALNLNNTPLLKDYRLAFYIARAVEKPNIACVYYFSDAEGWIALPYRLWLQLAALIWICVTGNAPFHLSNGFRTKP